MLSKKLCKKCYEENGLIWCPSWLRKLRYPEHHDADAVWEDKDYVKCPAGGNDIHGAYDTKGNPPRECPYWFEHITETQHFDPKLGRPEPPPPMEVDPLTLQRMRGIIP